MQDTKHLTSPEQLFFCVSHPNWQDGTRPPRIIVLCFSSLLARRNKAAAKKGMQGAGKRVIQKAAVTAGKALGFLELGSDVVRSLWFGRQGFESSVF